MYDKIESRDAPAVLIEDFSTHEVMRLILSLSQCAEVGSRIK